MTSRARFGRKHVWMLVLAAVAVGIGALVAAIVQDVFESRGASPIPAHVPSEWEAVRSSPGHVVHLANDVSCDGCHAAEEGGAIPDGGVFTPPPVERCGRCHEDVHATVHPAALEGAPNCIGCHQFGSDATIVANDCLRCHGEAHGPPGMVLTRHLETECISCHRPHEEPSLLPRGCTGCHEVTVSHDVAAMTEASCLGCHNAHESDPAPTSDRCTGCHEDTTSFGHARCIDCHTPHQFAPSAAKPCTTCHTDVSTLAATAASTVPAHQRCVSCHDPHARRPLRPAAAVRRCASCHQDIHADQAHAGIQQSGPCIGCHTPHPARAAAADPTASCARCHDIASRGAPAHAASLTCASCHTAHDFAMASTPRACGTCHGAELAATASVAGHATCARCHTTAAHAPRSTPTACSSCHRQEHTTAPQGHRDCADCHTSHAGALRAGARCATCHRAQAAEPHFTASSAAARGNPNACASCHRAHGPGGVAQPPRCASCHAPSSLPSLHWIAEHRTCTDCHRAHEAEPNASRRTCTGSCHQDRVAHEPTAQQCNGCHLFK